MRLWEQNLQELLSISESTSMWNVEVYASLKDNCAVAAKKFRFSEAWLQAYFQMFTVSSKLEIFIVIVVQTIVVSQR